MSTVDHDLEPNQTVAKLHLSAENFPYQSQQLNESDLNRVLENWMTEYSHRPSGATITAGTGLWFPTDENGDIQQDKKEIEDNFLIEVWIDTEEELEAMRELKIKLEQKYEQHCVCLKIEDVVIEH